MAFNNETSTTLVLSILCLSAFLNLAFASELRFRNENRLSYAMTAVGDSSEGGNIDSPGDTDSEIQSVAKYQSSTSASPITHSAYIKENIGQLKDKFSGHYKQASHKSLAWNKDSNKYLPQRLATNAVDVDIFQEKSIMDNLSESFSPDFRDEFPCLKCRCYLTFQRYIVASCNSSIAEIKASLPNATRQLTISNSTMKVFQAKDFVQYHSLHDLLVIKNKHMHEISNRSQNIKVLAVKLLDLSFNAISDIKGGSFKMFPLLLELNLAHNHIRGISTFAFEGLGNLQHLNLSQNNISVFINGSLSHFKKLKVLDLSSSNIHRSFMPGVFSNLANLHNLFLNGNLKNSTSYPNGEIARLTNLISLSIDGISSNVTLGPEIKALRRLLTLRVECTKQSECHLKTVTEPFLANVQYLHTLRFTGCPLTSVEEDVYKHVPKLRSLEFISTYPYDIFKALAGLRGLQNSSLKSLSLIRLIADRTPFVCLYGRHAMYLKSLELEFIDLSGNRVGYMDIKFINCLPRTLKKLVLRGNVLIEPLLLTDKLFFLQNLETIDLGSYKHPASSDGLSQIQTSSLLIQTQANSGLYQKHYVTEKVKTDDYSENRDATYNAKNLRVLKKSSPGEMSNERFIKNYPYYTSVCTEMYDISRGKDNGSTANVFNKPQEPSLHKSSLKYLLAREFLEIDIDNFFENITNDMYPNLTYIDFSYCALPSLPVKTYLPLWVQKVNFNGNYFKHIHHHAFLENNSLTYLSLKNNVLGNIIAIKGEQAFKKLHQLVYLDISMNMIYKLPTDFFEGLGNLRILKMRDNKLGLLNTNFSTTPKLEYLDLRKNSITWISKSTRDDLDIIATTHPLYVELLSNPFRCTCEGLEVLHWILMSNIYFVSKDNLKCIRDDGSVEDVGNIEDRVEALQRQCAGKSLIIVLCVASLAVVCFLVVFGVMYRFRWQLRYVRNIALSRLVGFKPRESTSQEYRYDAFIVYSDRSRQFVVGDCLQELEVKRGHKLCVDDRDFMPGTLSISAIVSAIQNSRKTVLILSPDFYDEEFSEYAVKMALMEEIYQKRPVLYLCVYRPLPDDELSKSYDLLMVMKRNNYLEFPPEIETGEEVRQHFWKQLSEKIGRTVARELQDSAASITDNL